MAKVRCKETSVDPKSAIAKFLTKIPRGEGELPQSRGVLSGRKARLVPV